jgi:hypothetical protein
VSSRIDRQYRQERRIELLEEESKKAESKEKKKKMTLKEEKELEKFWNTWKPADKTMESAGGMECTRGMGHAIGMEHARIVQVMTGILTGRMEFMLKKMTSHRK